MMKMMNYLLHLRKMIQMNELIFNFKEIRSKVIKKYMQEAGIDKAVCFSCGNASKALINAGVNTLDISPTGELVANKWYTPAEVAHTFPNHFDATSGHLPLHLMIDIANAFKNELGKLAEDKYLVPTGSGETITCLNIAYKDIEFVPVYNKDAATEYSDQAPLNHIVLNTAKEIKGLYS